MKKLEQKDNYEATTTTSVTRGDILIGSLFVLFLLFAISPENVKALISHLLVRLFS